MSIQSDFDRIALVSPDGELHNEHYHNFLLKHLPAHCDQALEIGCGTGAFARALAARSNHVLGVDLSPEMIRLARERSTQLSKTQRPEGHQGAKPDRGQEGGKPAHGREGGVPPPSFSNIEFQVADICDWEVDSEYFDCIASIATLHHLPFRDVLVKMKSALKPGGVLLILDLFEPHGLSDWLLNFPALSASTALRLLHHGRLRPSREVRAAWAAHEAHDLYPTMNEVRSICADLLPNAQVKQHLLCRYSLVWRKGNIG